MQCDRGPDASERYVTGTMPEPEQTAFEEHFFACEECFRAVQALQDAQQALRSEAETTAGAPRALGALPAAAMAIAAMLIAGVVVWRLPRPVETPPTVAAPREARTTPAPDAPATPAGRPIVPPTPAPSSSDDRAAENRLELLAVVMPPQFVAMPTRSEADADLAAFNDAMTHYSARRYSQAARGLRVIARRSPDLAHVQFFLGISELMVGNTRQAREALQQSAASRVAPYADEAHFYLAKAALQAKDLASARKELQIAIDREAGPAGEAARVLAELKN